MRVAMYYSGSKWQLDLFQFDKYRALIDRVIYAPDLSVATLAPFDVIVVPRESNQELLYLKKQILTDFLGRGGTIVSFGELTRPWLPEIQWRSGSPKFVYDGKSAWEKGYLDNKPMIIADTAHPVFRDLSVDDLTWHFHGSLIPPESARVLVRYGEADCIALEHEPADGGYIFASTLDPIVHAGYGVVKKTHRFLDAVLTWVREPEAQPAPV